MTKIEMTNEEAIKRLKEARTTIQPYRYVNEAIDYAIKALEQTRWIPVSERLPEEFQCVLVTTGSRVDVCTYLKGSAYWKSYVLAWMPLPEPYKAESEDKE